MDQNETKTTHKSRARNSTEFVTVLLYGLTNLAALRVRCDAVVDYDDDDGYGCRGGVGLSSWRFAMSITFVPRCFFFCVKRAAEC